MSNTVEKTVPVPAVPEHSMPDRQDELIDACRRGDRAAFDEFMRQYQRQVFRTAYRLLGDFHQAEQVAQDVFIRAYGGIKNFRGDAAVTSWLYAITVNLCRNVIRQQMRRRKQEVPFSAIGAEDAAPRDVPDTARRPDRQVSDKETAGLIIAEINRLEPEFREPLVLRDMEAMAYEDIARILSINIGTVKSRIHRARERLRQRLEGVLLS